MTGNAEEALTSGKGGVAAMNDGTTIASGLKGLMIFRLVQARSALRLEVNGNGMIASRAVNAKTIIPWLVTQEITQVQPPYTKARKVRAWNDLNDWMIAHGFEAATLERKPRRATGQE